MTLAQINNQTTVEHNKQTNKRRWKHTREVKRHGTHIKIKSKCKALI
jgi:hypothetical protein